MPIKTPRQSLSLHTIGLLAFGLVLSGCSAESGSNESMPQQDRAAADIGDLSAGGQSVQYIMTPEGYKRGDKLIAYEGPGWESDKTAFRLYLDGRNALDVFGKKVAEPVLTRVGRGDDYHAMADWGMDILKVGNSLGAGGFGVFENGEVRQIGPAQRYSATVKTDTSEKAAVEVIHKASESCQNDMSALYSIEAGERMSGVTITGQCALPLAAGLIIHPDTKSFASTGMQGWQYKGRYGAQSLVPDNLGLALFYRAEDVALIGQDADDDYIVFRNGVTPQYYTAAAWAQEIDGIQDAKSFQDWLKSTHKNLNKTKP
jgi:hypothetical protein